jgi:cellulose synthase operon protein C
MRRSLGRLRAVLLAATLLSPLACGPAANVKPPARPPSLQPIEAIAINDAQLATSVQRLLLDGSESPSRESLLVAVVRKLFTRAGERFDAGDPQRGMATLTGALYLVRSGELRPEMFDASAAHAFERALEVVAPAGDEARSLAFLSMQAASLPKDSPVQGQIQSHMRALGQWLTDTRNRSEVENASADGRTYGELAMIQPGPETLSRGTKAAERWVSAAIEFQSDFKPGIDNPRREQLVEAYRGVRAGWLVIAALHLRHGDALGASKALESSEARKITPPGFQERLDSAAHGTDPLAWREIAALYGNAGTDDNLPVSQEIARGAAWGALLEAYRRSPNAVETSVPMAEMLLRLGMAEAGAAVLAETAQENKNASVTAGILALVLKMTLAEDQSHDGLSARRVFQAAQPILTLADALPDRDKLDPSPAQMRFAMAAVETRNGEIPAARALLERGLRDQATIQGWTLLADIQHQAGDDAGALGSLTRGLSAPDAPGSPIARADAHLLAYRIHRGQRAEQAGKALGDALRAALEARSGSANPTGRALAERVLARVSYHYGDRAAVARAITRGFATAGNDKGAAGMVAIEASSTALLMGDLPAARAALTKAMELNIDDDDLVYVALWVQLLEHVSKAKPAAEDPARKALESIPRSGSWTSALSDWGRGKLDDAALGARARDASQRTEAAFYAALRKWSQGDGQATRTLEAIAKGPAIQLVETHIAEELTVRPTLPASGPPPAPLP